MRLARGLHFIWSNEAVAVGVDLLEVRREARGVGLRFGEAHAAVAVGIQLLPVLRHALLALAGVLGAHLLVEGAQLVGRQLAVMVGVDLVEALGDARQGLGLVAAHAAVAIRIGLLEAL